MMNVKFEFNDDLLRKRMGLFTDKVLPYMKVTWGLIANDVMREAILATPPPRNAASWDLRASWTAEEVHPTDAVTQFIIKNTYKAKDGNEQLILLWFEEGTKAHEIRPVNAKALHFFVGSDEIFAKNVRHPGTPAWRMFETAARRADVLVDKYMTETFQMIDRMMESAGGSVS